MWSEKHKRKSTIDKSKISAHTRRFHTTFKRDNCGSPVLDAEGRRIWIDAPCTTVRNLVCCGQRPRSGRKTGPREAFNVPRMMALHPWLAKQLEFTFAASAAFLLAGRKKGRA